MSVRMICYIIYVCNVIIRDICAMNVVISQRKGAVEQSVLSRFFF